MKYLKSIVFLLLLVAGLSSCYYNRPGYDRGMNHRRTPGWHRGPGYGHGTGYHGAPPNYRH